MKVLMLLTLFIACLFLNCASEGVNKSVSDLSHTPHPYWPLETLKPNFKIQFSQNYIGGLLNESEPYFIKKRNDEKVIFEYDFCDAFKCDYFGEILPKNNLSTITYIAPFGKKYLLVNRKNLMHNNQLIGIFYFDSQEKVTGKVFLNHNSVFKEAFTVKYPKDFQNEVEEIIQTIQIVTV